MLHLDVTAALAKTITPSMGIPDQELGALRTSMRRYVSDWLIERQRGEHSWTMGPYDKLMVERVKEAAIRIKGEGVTTVVWIGIGGSGLGPRVIQEAFEGPDTLEFIVLDTLDPAVLSSYMSIINWKSTFVVVASKSGDTLEPMSLFFLCWEQLKKARKERACERVIALTDPEQGFLHSFSLENGIQMLPIPSGVGGRYSIFTPIGLLPLAILNGNVDAFVRGAKEMDTLCQQPMLEDNPAALLGSVQYVLDTKRGYNVRVIMPYSQRLASVARWNQQLIAESLGKKETSNPIPLSAIGTQDQHSLLQQWMAGPRKTWHVFIRDVEKPRLFLPEDLPAPYHTLGGKTMGQLLDACYEGTSQALTNAKRPHVTITMQLLDAYNLGQLFFLFMAEVVLLGKLYRIDPYGQPGVEMGKSITKEILSHSR